MKADFSHQMFTLMDDLSLQKVPYFFIIDFFGHTVKVIPLDELESSSIIIDFPTLKTAYPKVQTMPKHYLWEITPPSFQAYKKGFDLIKKHILNGDSFLANYTCQSALYTDLSAEEIFTFSKAKYKIYYPEAFVCFSPETFIQTQGDKIFTYPMKGTIDASVENAEQKLRNSLKEKAEHYTVVDLLRNDLSKVAKNVRVTHFQNIEKINTHRKTLLTMNSEICGQIKPQFQYRVGSIFKALLPAGSILGAPKPKTLEIITQAEDHKRGFYTGIAGFFDGENIDSCVMIRFIEIKKNQFFFKSGGGITHQSCDKTEYQEVLDKIYLPL